MSKFAFIQCGEQGKVIEDDDWLVRAHCMLGKNTKKHDTKRRAKRKDKTLALRASKVSASYSPIATPPQQLSSKIPASVREDLSAYLAGPVDRESWFYLWRFSCFLPDMYPLDSYMDEVPFLEELPPSDGSALTTALLTASAHNDYVSRLGLSNRTRQLTVYTCSYLNDVLSKNDPRSRYSAIFGIFHLAAAAVFCQQHDTAYTHLNGMFEVIRSFDAEHETPDSESTHSIASIKFKAERLAFCLFNITGRKGPFLTEPSIWNPSYDSFPSARLPLSTSPKLDSIFHDFRDFCRLVREKAADGLKVDAKYFRGTINSLQTRVMDLPQGSDAVTDAKAGTRFVE
ncbi:hypothetical protein GRF29_77g1610455 [Pseudopithomyces chartarum]|uniref:Transcription factor domain-containing protein n=1 Tax=Pseudopithomyces chartarum TaxID=1892770 RepID=A0AAN6RIR0_9PLEO|nr:hypothetical protein GRF29_77g1610455 [Pseudopithomyces chartarum]